MSFRWMMFILKMDVDEASISISSSSINNNVTMYPIVIMSISDHYMRDKAECTQYKIVGVLMGVYKSSKIEILKTIELVYSNNGIKEGYLNQRLSQIKSVEPDLEFIGCYSIGNYEALSNDCEFFGYALDHEKEVGKASDIVNVQYACPSCEFCTSFDAQNKGLAISNSDDSINSIYIQDGNKLVKESLDNKTLDYFMKDINDANELSEKIKDVNVFGVTCLSANNPILSKVTFDLIVIDEAAQITMPVTLIPLVQMQPSSQFVMFSDVQQLPPLITYDDNAIIDNTDNIDCDVLDYCGSDDDDEDANFVRPFDCLFNKFINVLIEIIIADFNKGGIKSL